VASNAIRGSRVGSGPMRLDEPSDPIPRRRAAYWCANGHVCEPFFAADVCPPDTWDCPHCGLPAGPDPQAPPPRPQAAPFKTHLAYVKERRSDAEAEAILVVARAALRPRRGGADLTGAPAPAASNNAAAE
jgi:hypothetical protein